MCFCKAAFWGAASLGGSLLAIHKPSMEHDSSLGVFYNLLTILGMRRMTKDKTGGHNNENNHQLRDNDKQHAILRVVIL